MLIGPKGIVVEVTVYSWWVRSPGKATCDIQGAPESSVAGRGRGRAWSLCPSPAGSEAFPGETVTTMKRTRKYRAGVHSKTNNVRGAGEKLGFRSDRCWEGTVGKVGFNWPFPLYHHRNNLFHIGIGGVGFRQM